MAHQQESFLPFSSRQSLSCCLSRVAKRSTAKPRGPLPFPSEPHGLLFTSPKLPDPRPSPPKLVVLSFPSSEPRGPLSVYLLKNLVVLPPMAARPRFKSQHPSSFAAPFPTPPTVSYTCQHPHILPTLLGCHSKSGQVWPHGVEPIISKLSRRPCNQGELLPRPILGGSHSHLPGSKQGHSYLTYL